MKSVGILQARTNSTRLPGKVLLPIGGVPMVVLAARRAANTGREIIVATSNQRSDDALAALLADSGIRCYRGSLDNTLQRFVGALEGYSDDTPVFRLTADNVFPDGALLDEMEEEFLRNEHLYLWSSGEKSGLPYGMSVELTRARLLREAAASTQDRTDQEHVTPYIRRTCGDTRFQKYRHLNKSHFRCTVDCLDDYLAILHVFSGVAAPDRIPALELVERLSTAPYQPKQATPAGKLVLGTAQLGLTYGIANHVGKPDQATAETLIKGAIANGAAYIDTARAYGNSEEVIGEALKSGWDGRAQIVTKLSPLTGCPETADPSTVNAWVDASIFRSCVALRRQHLDVLMLHRATHLVDWSGAAWARLLEHKADGRLKALGVSVQSPAELEMALAISDVEFVQLPFNVLDWRWDALISTIRATRQKRRLVVHVRSVLLQGLLPSTTAELWHRANVAAPQPIMDWLARQSHDSGRSGVADFCLSYVKSLDWVDGLVVGMETCEQLDENVRILCGAEFTEQQLQKTAASRPLLSEQTLNPVFWRQ